MGLNPELLTLAEEAEARAKRSGAPATAWHVAQVIAGRDQEVFEKLFGEGAAGRVRAAPEPEGALPSARETLEGLADASPSAVSEHLRELIGEWIADSDVAPPGESAGEPLTTNGASIQRAEHPLLQPVDPREPPASQRAALLEVVAQLARRHPGAPLLTAASGAGRTSAASGLAALCMGAAVERVRGWEVVRLSAGKLLEGDPGRNLDVALDALQEGQVAYVDDLEMLLGLPFGGYDRAVAMRLRVGIERHENRIVLAINERYASRLEGTDAELLADCITIPFPPLSREDLEAVVTLHADQIADHHGVIVGEQVRRLALAPSPHESNRAHPGLAIDRLDAACARAVLREAVEVTDDDIGLDATPEVAPITASHLAEHLADEVRGQDLAIARVVRRVALARAELDLRPERPDGVLLFVGPTGVGKTQLAKALCRVLFGDEDRLVRLDMSEYADQWAISRLIGPQPGYVGYTEPDAWLTTRIRRQPRTVLLLDEIEKAHPTVWNTFLQVFDAGRMTDPRGNVADFAHVVVVMTSNLGAGTFSAPKLGFAPREEQDEIRDAEDRTREAVRAAMRPELLNRLDDIVVFRPLTEEAIREIAEHEIGIVVDRLSERGYDLEVGQPVVDAVAQSGYDPDYGARHLQRNIERMLLMSLADAPGRKLRACAGDDGVVWTRRE